MERYTCTRPTTIRSKWKPYESLEITVAPASKSELITSFAVLEELDKWVDAAGIGGDWVGPAAEVAYLWNEDEGSECALLP